MLEKSFESHLSRKYVQLQYLYKYGKSLKDIGNKKIWKWTSGFMTLPFIRCKFFGFLKFRLVICNMACKIYSIDS